MFLATTGLVWAASAGIGPLLGGVFTQYLNWRWVFLINLPCCFAAFVVLYMFLNTINPQATTIRQGRKMDWFGVCVLACVTALGGGTMRDTFLGHYPLYWVGNPYVLLLVCG